MTIQPKIVKVEKDIACLGLMTRTTVKTVYKDLPRVFDEYMKLFNKNLITNVKRPWEYVSLSQDYDRDLAWDYYTGHVVTKYGDLFGDMVKFEVPKGEYAVFEIRSKRQFLFGTKIGRVKRYAYTKWLPSSGYEFSGVEYEYNDEAMKKRNPYDVDLYIGIRKKQGTS